MQNQGPWPVKLHLYDLSNGMAAQMSQMIIGKRIDGIWHTGIVVYGYEYYFGGGICKDPPLMTPYGKPIKEIPLGETELPQDVFMDFLNEIQSKFSMQNYDLFKNNCNNFTNECSEFLLGMPIPSYIVDLPNEVLKTPMGASIAQMVNGAQNQAAQNSHPLFSPAMVEGNNNQSAMFGHQQGSSQGGQMQELSNMMALNQMVQSNKLVVMDMFADWCGPCQAIKPFFASLPNSYPGIKFVKADIDKARDIAQRYGVQSIPTFLYFANGQMVKKQSGANQSDLSANVQWLKQSYGGQSDLPLKPQKNSQFVQWKEETQNFYFEGKPDSWNMPIKKIDEYAQKHKLYKEKFAQTSEMLTKSSFNDRTRQERNHILDFVIQHLPMQDCSNLLPFIDFLRLYVLQEADAKYFSTGDKNTDAIREILQVYFIDNSFPQDQNPKMVRVITWRLLANMAKNPCMLARLVEDREFVAWAASEVFKGLVTEGSLVNATVMTLNNLLFAEGGLDLDDDRKSELLEGLFQVVQGNNENSQVAAVNLSILMIFRDKSLLKKYGVQDKKSKVEELTGHSNVAISKMAKDLLFIMGF